MGTWGVGLYADDTALDLRTEWSTRMRWGGKPEKVTDDLLATFGDDDTTFWLVLADLQWKTGHLLPRVRDEALGIIDDGTDLARWKDAGGDDREARAAMLNKLRAQLESPPPPAKVYTPPKASATPMKTGEVYAWRLLDGRFAFFHVCGMCRNLGVGPAPSVRVIDLVSEQIPPLEHLAPLPSRKAVKRFERAEKAEPTFLQHPQAAFGTFGPRQYPKARLRRLGVLPIPEGLDDKTKVIGSSWLGADEFLWTMFGLGWWIGDLLAWKRRDGEAIILSLCDVGTLRQGTITLPYVSVEILAWSGSSPPSSEVLGTLSPIKVPGGGFHGPRFNVKGLPPAGRFELLGRVERGPAAGVGRYHEWQEVDAIFAQALAWAE